MAKAATETFIGRARRRQLVQCAIDTIADVGFAQASVRKIAERADVALSVVMHHIGHKDDLVAAVVDECYRSLLDVMVPAVTAEVRAQDKLAAHIRTHLRYIGTHPAHQSALTEIASGYRTADGRRLYEVAIAEEHLPSLHKVGLESVIRAGIDSGEFRDVAPDSLAAAIRGAIGAALIARLTDPDFDLTRYGDDLVDAFTRACLADS